MHRPVWDSDSIITFKQKYSDFIQTINLYINIQNICNLYVKFK